MGRRSVVIEVPGDVDRNLSRNASRELHWSTKRRAEAAAKSAAKASAMGVIGSGRDASDPYFTRKVTVFITRGKGYGRKTMDPDGLMSALKWHIDGMTAAGVWRDDSRKWVEYDKPVEVRDPAGVGFIRFQITEAEAV